MKYREAMEVTKKFPNCCKGCGPIVKSSSMNRIKREIQEKVYDLNENYTE